MLSSYGMIISGSGLRRMLILYKFLSEQILSPLVGEPSLPGPKLFNNGHV